MPDERALVLDLVLIIAAAAGGGVVAALLRLPVVVGYLVAGLLVGHYIPGVDIGLERVQDIADLGVALLLFALGVQFSFGKLAEVRVVAAVAGVAQIGLTIALGAAIGSATGLETGEAVLLGAAMSLSSTMVALKVLDARGELDTVHGRVAVGMLLVQDLAVGPLIILVPAAVGESGRSIPLELAQAAGKTALILAGAFILATRVVPWLLFRVAASRSRELFLLTVLSLAFGLAASSYALGLGVAFGAFLAGLVVSESEFSYQTLADVIPLRDVLATIFFVSMGLLIDPAVFVDDPVRVVAIVAGLVVGKFIFTALPVRALRYPARAAALTGFALAQGGEFSFVLTRVGIDEGIISDELGSTFLLAVLVSILANPLLVQAGPWLLDRATHAPILGGLLAERMIVSLGEPAARLENHVVVCGFGDVGRELVREVTRRDFRCIVIEQNPYLFDELKRLGLPRVYGDAASPAVLDACALERARVLAVTLPNSADAQRVLQHARAVNPRLDVIARGLGTEDHERLTEAGASEVVHPQFEAGLEFVRHTLQRFGVDSTQVQALLSRRRRDFYGRA